MKRPLLLIYVKLLYLETYNSTSVNASQLPLAIVEVLKLFRTYNILNLLLLNVGL
jgi:hypothetical protein